MYIYIHTIHVQIYTYTHAPAYIMSALNVTCANIKQIETHSLILACRAQRAGSAHAMKQRSRFRS